MNYTDKLVEEARLLAVSNHMGQKYGIFPYEKHLNDVIEVLERFDVEKTGFIGFEPMKKYIIAALTHDLLEDTPISYNDIRVHFGHSIAEIIYCVTDELGRNREDRKEKTLPKIASNYEAIIIKLADRIANIEAGGKVGMYAKEYPQFRNALFASTPHKDKFEEEFYLIENYINSMWGHLDKLMGYEK